MLPAIHTNLGCHTHPHSHTHADEMVERVLVLGIVLHIDQHPSWCCLCVFMTWQLEFTLVLKNLIVKATHEVWLIVPKVTTL